MSSDNAAPSAMERTPIWKVPQAVLVPGLLLVGVIATSVMVVVSAIGQDPVLDKDMYERERLAAQALQGDERAKALLAAQPANQGRNHAASPVVPK
jgi:hypothetical protein